jgi:hypothetical protein
MPVSPNEAKWLVRVKELAQAYYHESWAGGRQTSDEQGPEEVDFAVWIMLERGREQGREGLKDSEPASYPKYSGPAHPDLFKVRCLIHDAEVLPAGDTWHVIDDELDLADTWCSGGEGDHTYKVEVWDWRKGP